MKCTGCAQLLMGVFHSGDSCSLQDILIYLRFCVKGTMFISKLKYTLIDWMHLGLEKKDTLQVSHSNYPVKFWNLFG